MADSGSQAVIDTMRAVKLDLYLDPDDLLSAGHRAAWAERLGFAGVFAAETSHDPFQALARVTDATERIEVATAIAVAFARSPTELAHSAWDLAAASGGRFLLGLGTQVRAHITRRFSMEWTAPGPRLAEYIGALRAIWRTWRSGEPLRFEGDHYRLSLMTPFFSPQPIEELEIPIYIAGVGPFMCRLAGELCDGLHVHPFHTVRYLDEVTLPNMEEGVNRAGREREEIERAATVFVVTGRNEEEMARSAENVKRQLAFYASTPTYAPVLELHGWDFGPSLTAMSRRGEWAEMGTVIPDEALNAVAVRAPIEELGAELVTRYSGRLDRVGLYWSGFTPTDQEWAGLLDSMGGSSGQGGSS